MLSRFEIAALAAGALLLASCGGTPQPAPPSASASAPTAASASAPAPASVATSKPASAQAMSQVSAAYVGPFDNMAVMWLGKDMGLFANHGLDVDLKLISGSPIASAALLKGDVNYVEMSGPAVVNSVSQGATEPVMIAGFENVFIFTMMVDPSIKSVADLKGKTAAVTLVGAEDDAVLRKVLRDNHLEPDVDVHITAARDPGGQLAAFTSKQAQLVMTGGANIAQLKKVGAVPLLDVGKLRLPFQSAGLVTTRSYIAGHRDEALNMVKASVDAIRRIKSDKAGTEAIMSKYMKTEDRDVLDASWQSDNNFMEDVPMPTADGFQEIMNERKVTGHKPQDFFDGSLVQELRQSGYFK
jgi:NitT/TauT family transport system substrate-binding protein